MFGFFALPHHTPTKYNKYLPIHYNIPSQILSSKHSLLCFHKNTHRGTHTLVSIINCEALCYSFPQVFPQLVNTKLRSFPQVCYSFPQGICTHWLLNHCPSLGSHSITHCACGKLYIVPVFSLSWGAWHFRGFVIHCGPRSQQPTPFTDIITTRWDI